MTTEWQLDLPACRILPECPTLRIDKTAFPPACRAQYYQPECICWNRDSGSPRHGRERGWREGAGVIVWGFQSCLCLVRRVCHWLWQRCFDLPRSLIIPLLSMMTLPMSLLGCSWGGGLRFADCSGNDDGIPYRTATDHPSYAIVWLWWWTTWATWANMCMPRIRALRGAGFGSMNWSCIQLDQPSSRLKGSHQ